LFIGTAVAIRQAYRATDAEQSAKIERDRARQSELETRRLLYAADVRLAADAWKNNDIARMHQALSRQRPEPGDPDFRSFEWFYLWQQTGVESRTLAEATVPFWTTSFSPDGRWLAISGADAIIRLFDGDSYESIGSIKSGQIEVNGLAFSPDSRTLATAC
jgi:hypothetical protein